MCIHGCGCFSVILSKLKQVGDPSQPVRVIESTCTHAVMSTSKVVEQPGARFDS